MRSNRLLLALVLLAVTLALAGWLIVAIGDLHDRLAVFSRPLAVAIVVVMSLAATASAVAAARLFWQLGREASPAAQAPDDVIKAAEVQAEKAEGVLAQVKDQSVKARLGGELAAIRADGKRRTFHVVVFGTGSAGKTSLINALIGRTVGRTEATMGTTQHGENHTYSLEGVDGTLYLTDTPGLSEVGSAGAEREAEARDLAARADLLLFVLDHDLVRSEFEPLLALARQGKRSIVVLNKKDRFVDADRAAILSKLRQRLEGVVPPEDVVAVAAAPQPTMVRVRGADGSIETILESALPDLDELEDRIEAVLEREGDALRAGNLLLRAHLVSKAAQEQLTRERRERAEVVVDKFQWITAGTVFANPIPALDLMAAGAVQFQMISEIAGAYGVELSTAHVKMIGGQMIQILLKLGMVEAATSLVAGLFKSSLVGYAAGGAVQATTMAYLTHVSGQSFIAYFERGQSWGDGGMQAALVRQFDLNSRADFLQEFARQALGRVIQKVAGPRSGSAPR
jgi:small GTP-binding protein